MRSTQWRTFLAPLALCVFVGCFVGCGSGDDDGSGDSSGADAAVAAIDAAGVDNDTDAAVLPTADAGPPPDAFTGLCAEPGAEGNSNGVGRYCTVGGGECEGTSAPFCTVDFEASADPFCTTLCFSDESCGENSSCQNQGGQSGCVPNCILD